MSLLHEVAASGRREECERLLLSGEDVNAPDDLGWTPLMHAVRNGHHALARTLLSHGAHVDIHNQHGVTALPLAVEQCDEQLLGLLFSGLSPSDLRQAESEAALCVASVCGLYGAARWILVNTPAQVNKASPITGATPLMLAVMGGHCRVVELLLRAGADSGICSALGQDAWQLALTSSNARLIQLLSQNYSPSPKLRGNTNKPQVPLIDPHYTSNNIYLDVNGDVVLKNSPNRPVFKTCNNGDELSKENEVIATLGSSARSVFLPSPSRLHCNYSLSSLISPRHAPFKSPSRGKKRKLPNNIGCSSWLKRITKRRTKSLEDSDNCLEFDDLKQNGMDFSRLLFDLGLDEYFPIFKEQELDMWSFLTLTTEDLEAMGIHDEISQARILKSVEILRKAQL